jgi:hypothetical protein
MHAEYSRGRPTPGFREILFGFSIGGDLGV